MLFLKKSLLLVQGVRRDECNYCIQACMWRQSTTRHANTKLTQAHSSHTFAPTKQQKEQQLKTKKQNDATQLLNIEQLET